MTEKRPSRLFVAFERLLLGAGMSIVAFFIERRLIKAIKKGSVEPARHTAEGGGDARPDGTLPGPEGAVDRIGLTVTPHQVAHQAKR